MAAKKKSVNNGKQFFDEETGTYKNQIVTLLKRVDQDDIRLSRGCAFQDLSPAAFGLYILASMDNDYFARKWQWEIARSWCGMSYSTYRRAIGELVQKEYIKDGYFDLGAGIKNIEKLEEEKEEILKNESKQLQEISLKNENLSKMALKNESQK